MATETDHTCHIDCELTVKPNGNREHMMYPADPTPHAGRYQATENLTLTRREYRASGQDESRNVREWNYNRSLRSEAPLYRNAFFDSLR